MPFEYKPGSIVENTNIQDGRSYWCRLRLDRVVWKPTIVRFPTKGNWPVQNMLDDTHILFLNKCRMLIGSSGVAVENMCSSTASERQIPALLCVRIGPKSRGTLLRFLMPNSRKTPTASPGEPVDMGTTVDTPFHCGAAPATPLDQP
jgi:hypothetical protein